MAKLHTVYRQIFMIEHRPEAGDGGNFKKTTWQAAFKGPPKTWSSCKSKWQNVGVNLVGRC
jgi:hypothetical protein